MIIHGDNYCYYDHFYLLSTCITNYTEKPILMKFITPLICDKNNKNWHIIRNFFYFPF